MDLIKSLPPIEIQKKQWERTGILSIPNLLNDKADETHRYYFNKPNKEWNLMVYPKIDVDLGAGTLSHVCNLTDPDLQDQLLHIHQLRNKDQFTYNYERLDNSIEENYLHPSIREIFFSQEFLDYLSAITSYEDLTIRDLDCFMSRYSSGHYNGPHTDGDNGRLAFVYHLSKFWRTEYGGLFCRLDWNFKPETVVSPPFDDLLIFDTKYQGKQGSPHLVTEVAQHSDNKRISFTGWFQ
tara:strand:+ start:866 stop:1579 length:714 start_codon:yes stop_codon:yes gene_type:complete